MGDHVCMCMSAAWAIWKSHAFHVPKKHTGLVTCPIANLCLCFHSSFSTAELQIGRSEAAWVDADADAETETQNRHLQHGITYKFRMHDFALFWYLSNTCALNEVGVAVEVWVAVGVAVLSLEMVMLSQEICVWVRWGYVAIEWSRWTWKAWKKSTTATTSSRPLKAYSNLLPELTTSAQL